MSKLGNALAMLKLLETGKKYTVNQLADKLEVTPRMIKAYKLELEQAGIYIHTIYGKYGGYIYKQKNNYTIEFDYNDIEGIENIIDKVDEKDRTKLAITLEKIRSIVIYSVDESSNVVLDKELANERFLTISRAIKDRKDLAFKYNSKDRIFTPQTFTFFKEYIYITGFSKTDNEIRTLNISLMDELRIV